MREMRSCSDNCLLNVSTRTRYVLLTSVYADYTQQQAFYTNNRRLTNNNASDYRAMDSSSSSFFSPVITMTMKLMIIAVSMQFFLSLLLAYLALST